MAFQVTAPYFVEQETSFLVHEMGNKLQTKSIVMSQSTPYMVTEEGNINHFAGCKVENIYHIATGIPIFFKSKLKSSKWRKIKVFS